MRNKKMQARYDTWMVGMKEKFGSTGELYRLSIISSYEGDVKDRRLTHRGIPHPSPITLGIQKQRYTTDV